MTANIQSLKTLNLSRMQIGVGEMNDLKPFLTESSVLQSLNLYDNKLGVEGARVLAEALSLNSSL